MVRQTVAQQKLSHTGTLHITNGQNLYILFTLNVDGRYGNRVWHHRECLNESPCPVTKETIFLSLSF